MPRFQPGKLVLGFFVYASTIAVLMALAGMWWLDHEFRKPGPLTETHLFTIEPGNSLTAISRNLSRDNLIYDPVIFKTGARVTGAQSNLKAGEYELQPGMSARDILALMREGTTFGRRFTIPEGRTSYEIVQIINAVPELDGEITQIPEEGTLLPNTYDYRLGEDRSEIITRLGKAMTALRNDELCPQDACWQAPLKSWNDVMTLASIVEKETGIASERKRIAGVFFNRLKRGIPLQTDPTVIYAITKGRHKNDGQGPLGRRLLTKDLEIDSPYNTYKYPGLPPGPIANPGREAIEAVLEPEENDYIYFVADGTGGHIFSKTLEEHNRNAAQWRKIRREQGK